MLSTTKELKAYTLQVDDDTVGRVEDLLFDDGLWVVRYVVAKTEGWLSKGRVLLSPGDLETPDSPSKSIRVQLTRDQMEQVPTLDKEKTVSRQYEDLLEQKRGIPSEWLGKHLWGLARTPYDLRREGKAAAETAPAGLEGDPHLRSVDQITGYEIRAADGRVGHLEGLILNEESWTLPYLVVDTRNWLPGRKVLISRRWVDAFDWVETSVTLSLTTEEIEESPEWDPAGPLDRDYEKALHKHYRRPGYWL